MLEFGPTFERLSTLVDKARTVKKPRCLNPTCSLHGNVESTGIIRYGFYRPTAGKRRRYRCIGCGQTFSTTKGPPYDRLQHRRATFDSVVTLRVEGVSLSAIARIERLAWNTVARWLERAAAVCRHCSHGRTTGFVATELQADEIRSFTGGKTRPAWVFAAIEVWSRLWTSTVVGRRSYRNTLALVRDVATRMKFAAGPLIVTDGFEFYGTRRGTCRWVFSNLRKKRTAACRFRRGCTRMSRTSPSSSTARHSYCWRPWRVTNTSPSGWWPDP